MIELLNAALATELVCVLRYRPARRPSEHGSGGPGDLIAERVAIQSYSEMVRLLGDDDPTTRRLVEEILAVEEEHAEEISNMLENLGNLTL